MFSPGVHIVWAESFAGLRKQYEALKLTQEGRRYHCLDILAFLPKHFLIFPINLNKTVGQTVCSAPQTAGYTYKELHQLFIDAKFGNFWNVKIKDLNWEYREPLQVLLAACEKQPKVAVVTSGALDAYFAALKFLATRTYFENEGGSAIWFVTGPKENIEKSIKKWLGNVPYTLWACYSDDDSPVKIGMNISPVKIGLGATLEVVAYRKDIGDNYIEVKLLEGSVNIHNVFVDEKTGYRYVSDTYLLIYTNAVDEDGDPYEEETMLENITEGMCDTFCFEIACEDDKAYYPNPELGTILKAYIK